MIFEDDFVKKARRTLSSDKDIELHMAIGLCTEAGELLDAYKKHVFYGRELDIRNVKEEICDIVWYLEILCDELGYSTEQAKKDILVKLKHRYPDKFKDVTNRVIDEELRHM